MFEHVVIYIPLFIHSELNVEWEVLRSHSLNEPNSLLGLPVVSLYVLNSSSRWAIRLQHFVNQILAFLRNADWHSVVRCFNFPEQRRYLLVFKRKITRQHSEQNYSAAPNINFRSAIRGTRDYLWGSIVWRATGGLEKGAILNDVAKTKVNEFHIIVGINQNILRL